MDAIDWNNKGYSLAGRRLHLEAIVAYDHAIALDPSNPIFQKNKEISLAALNSEEKKKYIQLKTDDPVEYIEKSKHEYAIEWNNRAGVLFKEGKVNDAILAYDHAISLDPTQPVFWKNKANALKVIGSDTESESAKELFENMVTVEKQDPPTGAIYWNNKGHTLADEGKHSEAIDAYNHAIKIHSNFPEAWNNLGYSLAEMGRIEEAIAACYRAVEIKPEFAYSWIEKWLYLPDLLKHQETIISLHEPDPTKK